MKNIIFGILLGILTFFAFLYFGGASYITDFGAKTKEAGKELEKYEGRIKDSLGKVADKAGEELGESVKSGIGDVIEEKIEDTKKKTVEAIDSTKKAAGDVIKETKEKAMEYVP